MNRGKLIVIEGTDCSGKETQTELLIQKLREKNIKVDKFSFPNYNSPTGKIIGGPYLGKSYIGDSFFEEGPTHVDPKVAALYYTADRKYNIDKIVFLLENGANVILDRYIYSNMAHQGGKIDDEKQRMDMYNWLDNLEFNLMELPKPDIAVFLHMPTEKAQILKKNRLEAPDGHEKDLDHLKSAERAYKELVLKYNIHTIECVSNDEIRAIESINDELYEYVANKLK
ncbi:MAG: dTMP kinase [Bacilli bacterium]|nr:dTMP kinase [Bacilli bacterium]